MMMNHQMMVAGIFSSKDLSFAGWVGLMKKVLGLTMKPTYNGLSLALEHCTHESERRKGGPNYAMERKTLGKDCGMTLKKMSWPAERPFVDSRSCGGVLFVKLTCN